MVLGSRATRIPYFHLVIIFLVAFSFNINQTAGARQTWSLPAPWSAQDIGSPAIRGSAAFGQGTFTITAGGSDIGGEADQFSFIYQQITGDVDVIARVDSVSAANSGSKSGVMIRSSLTASAADGAVLVSAGGGVTFRSRASNGVLTTSTAGPTTAAPYWVRLVRNGTTVTAYASANGSTWSTISSKTIALGSAAYVGLATTSHTISTSTTAAVSQVSVTPLSLPAPLRAVDIGAPAIKGSTTYAQGVFTVRAGGADIWDGSDQFHFVYQPLNGDGEVIARVQSLTNTDTWAKTGVMIRETLAADSRHAFALVSAGAGYAFQRRIDPSGIGVHTAGPAGTAPGWLRLVRTGSKIDAYQSTTGTTWTFIGSDAIPMGTAVYVGIATTSHNVSATTTAVVDNFKVIAAGSTANQPPIVAITSPASGSIFTVGTPITVNAAASDSDGTVSRVDFYAGATKIASDTTAPYAATWSNAATGTYSLSAVAVDNSGASTTSATVSIRVDPATTTSQPPSVTLTAPANGATYTAPATISLTASVTANGSSVAKVEFYSGTTLLNSDTTAPYAFTWSSMAAGTYSLRAMVYDTLGASASSATDTITVNPAATTSLPAPMTAIDIGAPAIKGSTTYAQGVFTVRAGGADIWDVSDQFHFVYQPLNGDGEVIARVQSLTNTDVWAKTGVMIRETLAADSRHAFAAVTAAAGLAFQRRISPGGISSHTAGPAGTAPRWLRLVRTGSNIDAYQSTTGTTWTLIGSDAVPMGTAVYVGIATTSHNVSVATTAVVDNFKVIAGSTANQPPSVTLTAPANGTSYTALASVSLTATASDSDGIARVEFYSGSTLLNSDTASPYAFTWSNVAAGAYSVRAVAYDNKGASASSATSTITVNTTTTTSLPRLVEFTASPDHATLVTRYELRIYASGANPATAMPLSNSDLGKPAPGVNNDIIVDRSAFFSALAPGNYIAAVAAIGSGGASISAGVAFTR